MNSLHCKPQFLVATVWIWMLPSIAFAQPATGLDQPELIAAQSIASNTLKPSADFEPVWVWAKDAKKSKVTVDQEFFLDADPLESELQVVVAGNFQAFLDGSPTPVLKGSDRNKPKTKTITLKRGFHKLRIECENLDGPAGAIAAIRLTYPDGVLVVGTHSSATVLIDGKRVDASFKKAASAPWNQYKPESSKNVAVRREAQQLVNQIEQEGDDIATRAIVYLTYLAIEFPATDYEQTRFSLTKTKPTLRLLDKTRQVLRDQLSHNNPRYRDSALASTSLLLAKSDETRTLLDYFLSNYVSKCTSQEWVQSAVLLGVTDRLKADEKSFVGRVASAKKATQKKSDEVKAVKLLIDTNQQEMAKQQMQLLSLDARIQKSSDEEDIRNKERIILSEREIILNGMDPLDPIVINHKTKLRDAIKASDSLRGVIVVQANELNVSRTAVANKAKKLSGELNDLRPQLAKLSQDLNAIKEPAASESSFQRLEDIESFLILVHPESASSIIKSLVSAALDSTRELRRRYNTIESFSKADKAFAAASLNASLPAAGVGAPGGSGGVYSK